MNEGIINDIQALQRMTVGELRAEWERLYGEPTRSRNRVYLWRRLAWRVQELQLGGLSESTKEHIFALAPAAFIRSQIPAGFQPEQNGASAPLGAVASRRDPRIPAPGSTIVREYRGHTLRLQVLDDGFELGGVHYDSLSEAARVVTGQRWNGPLFWGLTKRNRKS